MAYYTGQASSLADLLTAIQTNCQAAGYTLSGDVLHKGTLYAELKITNSQTKFGSTRPFLTLRAGNGIDGSNVLQDHSNRYCGVGPFTNPGNTAWIDWTFPIDYFMHINENPDEVYVVVRYNAVEFHHLGFGQSPSPGCPGTGNWQWGTSSHSMITSNNSSYSQENNGVAIANEINLSTSSRFSWLPFWVDRSENGSNGGNRDAFHGLLKEGTAGWSAGSGIAWNSSATGATLATAMYGQFPLLQTQPNSWNNQSMLIPLHLCQVRPDKKMSIVGTLQHMRILRMDFIDPLDEINLTPDVWRVYPCKRKESSAPAGGTSITHSGCFGLAIRYVE